MGFLELFLLVLTPAIELRGAIPYGIATGMDPFTVGLFATVVNMALVFPIFIFLDHIFPLFENWDISKALFFHARKKAKPYVDRYGRVGLALFVAVPLPGSGVYTGALAAYVLGVPRHEALVGIAVGAALAGILVTCISAGFIPLFF